jgi:hypothetical protein
MFGPIGLLLFLILRQTETTSSEILQRGATQ